MQQGSEQQSSVVDLSKYRTAKATAEEPAKALTEAAARRAIEEIAHHLLMAVRVIKSLHQ